MQSKKGMVGLGETPAIAITMVVIAAIFVSGFLIISGLQDNISYSTDPKYSASAANGCNSTVTTQCTTYLATENITEGLGNITEYAPTWGVIIGVAVLLGIVLLGFGFARSRGLL